MQFDAGHPDLRKRISDHRLVAALDALLHERARHRHHEQPRVEAGGARVGERRVPDRFGNLGAQHLGRGIPQVLSLTHLRRSLLIDGDVHKPVHTCG